MDHKMKSYLSLIPISARVRRKQSRLIFVCIILAVFLVTTIFSLAEVFARTQSAGSLERAGNWHMLLTGIDESTAEQIAESPEVAASSWYDVLNLDDDLNMDKEYYIGGMQTALCGIEEAFIGNIKPYFSEGAHLNGGNEVILTENARELLGVDVGDSVTLDTPAGDHVFLVSGFRINGDHGQYEGSNGGDSSALLVGKDRVGAFLDIRVFREICGENNDTGDPQYYIQFGEKVRLRKAIAGLQEEYGIPDENISYNTVLMATYGISNNSYIQSVFPLAAVLFLMILAAGVLMISSSMNSNVSQRMQFFGMLRCIGASRSQIIRFVRLEALNWCKTAVPVGCALGVAAVWIVTWCQRNLVGGESSNAPYIISMIGILCGAAVGVITVFLAAQAPAKRAAKASPVSAVSGNVDVCAKGRYGVRGAGRSAKGVQGSHKGTSSHVGRVETALGFHHAVGAKKNLLLMTGSFAISIVLFLCFSVLITLVDCMLPQKASAPDLDITSVDLTNSIDPSLVESIEALDGVAHAFGRCMSNDVPAGLIFRDPAGSGVEAGEVAGTVDLISYSQYQLELLVKDADLRKGSDIRRMTEDSSCALAIWDRDMPLEIGDRVRIGEEELEIVGLLKYSPYSNNGSTDGKTILVLPEETYRRLTGETGYVIVEAQFESRILEVSNDAVDEIARLSREYDFRDRREESIGSMYLMFMVFVYGFVALIALIALLNIVNSISMSVTARINQYGAMRAIGMSVGQVTRMIAAEAFTYSAVGLLVGCGLGLPLSRWMFDRLVTSHFYYIFWTLPVGQIAVILVFVILAALAAVYTPSRRIRNMVVTETINEL